MDIQHNLQIVKNQIFDAEKRYQRPYGSVKLLAASKTRSVDEITSAIIAGQNMFGENYLQEALPKIEALKEYKNIVWHFIGPIQSNKTKLIAKHFTWVQSVYRIKIAKRLNDQRPSNLPPLNICIEINVSSETTKSGVTFQQLPDLAKAVSQLPRLTLRGLMAIPEETNDFLKQRANFHKVKQAFDTLKINYPNLNTLSMGMSNDFEAAIAEGATIIRLGTAIFGTRGHT
jgi:pyridoxal phosphate enzyme (YggS family)